MLINQKFINLHKLVSKHETNNMEGTRTLSEFIDLHGAISLKTEPGSNETEYKYLFVGSYAVSFDDSTKGMSLEQILANKDKLYIIQKMDEETGALILYLVSRFVFSAPKIVNVSTSSEKGAIHKQENSVNQIIYKGTHQTGTSIEKTLRTNTTRQESSIGSVPEITHLDIDLEMQKIQKEKKEKEYISQKKKKREKTIYIASIIIFILSICIFPSFTLKTIAVLLDCFVIYWIFSKFNETAARHRHNLSFPIEGNCLGFIVGFIIWGLLNLIAFIIKL